VRGHRHRDNKAPGEGFQFESQPFSLMLFTIRCMTTEVMELSTPVALHGLVHVCVQDALSPQSVRRRSPLDRVICLSSPSE